MTWRARTLKPVRLPYREDGQEDVGATVDVLTQVLPGGLGPTGLRLAVETHPVFQIAPLTKVGRAFLLTPGRLHLAYEIRRPSEDQASVLMLKLWQTGGRATLSASPRRVVAGRWTGYVIMTRDAVAVHHSSRPEFAWMELGTLMVPRPHDATFDPERARELDLSLPLHPRRRPVASFVEDALDGLKF